MQFFTNKPSKYSLRHLFWYEGSIRLVKELAMSLGSFEPIGSIPALPLRVTFEVGSFSSHIFALTFPISIAAGLNIVVT